MLLKYQLMLMLMTYLKFDLVDGIKCYACSVTKHVRDNMTIEQCNGFSESRKFEVDCPYSTMCEKKIVRYHLLNGIQTSFERGCAKQKEDLMVYVNRQWVKKSNVEEAYTEGCFNNTEHDKEYCYCRGELCNSSSNLKAYVIMYLLTPSLLLYMMSLMN